MKNFVRALCWCTTMLYACQQPAENVTPTSSGDALRAAAQPTKCDAALTIKIKSSVKDMDRLYLFEAMYVGRNGKDSTLAGSMYQDIINGDELSFSNLAFNKVVRVRFYENEADKTKFVSSGTFMSCGQFGGAEFDLRTLKMPILTPTTFQVKFPCTDVDQNKLPKTVTVEYRQTGTSFWFPLTILKREDIKKNLLQTSSYRLIQGRTYDVRLSVNGLLLTQNATLLNKDVWEVPVNSKLYCK